MMLSMVDGANVRLAPNEMGRKIFRDLTASPRGPCRSLIHNREIGLAFEIVDPRHNYLQNIAHRQTTFRLPADKATPRGIERIKIIA